MAKFQQGIFKPKNFMKYKGDSTKIVYRSSWELKFMKYLDMNDRVISWNSEEVIIPYISPIDNKQHRYFVDFWVKFNTKDGIKEFMIEIKPYTQTQMPKQPKRRTQRYLTEVETYIVNQAKWKYAKAYCDKNNMTFLVITEKNINFKT